MSFSSDIKKFADKVKDQNRQAQEQAKQNLRGRLEEVLGPDAQLVKGITLDTDVGKIAEIDAPPDVVDRLRAVGLMKD